MHKSPIAGVGQGVPAWLQAPTATNLALIITDKTGTGSLVFSNSPTLVTPALGTPSSANLANATGLPISTGVSGLGANVATFLATPNSSNLIAAVTDETGTGALVFANTPTLVTPVLGAATATSIVASSTVTANKFVADNQPCFSAHKNGTTQAVASGVFTKITSSVEVFDIGSFYDTTNSRWTPPAGMVHISAGLYVSAQLTVGSDLVISVYKDGVRYKDVVAAAAAAHEGACISIIDRATSSNYYEIYINGTTVSSIDVLGNANLTYFMGTVL